MEIKFFQAECGDASCIRFLGNDNKYHNVFIDSGYERTFRHVLENEIWNIVARNETIDIWVISHIHDDHIGGVIKYINTIKTGEHNDIVNQYFYNPPRIYEFKKSINNPSKIVSIDQGDILYEYLKTANKLQNHDITNSVNPLELAGLILTILSPSQQKLNKLRDKYPVEKFRSLEKQEDELISDAVAQKQNDYKILINDFDLEKWKEDNSIENGSSISILMEYNNKKILWLADSHPNEVVNSLTKMGFNKKNRIVCDWVKVTHHGSNGNNSDELYELINSENYLFSVNGENKHNLPSKECMARILRNKNRPLNSKYKFYFTYDNEILRSIFKTEKDNIFEEYNFEVIFNSNKYLAFNL
ncbi:MBL fold metallo-hydrolase [Flavobacterium sp.]|uniref:MBL fold metallo-hydrolase n=1 Tax=Flavobacterium sp. TaxID=239 RepID=UPI003BD23340